MQQAQEIEKKYSHWWIILINTIN